MAFDTRDRIHPAVNFVLAKIIASVGKAALGRIGKLITRLDLFLVSMTVGAERFMVAGVACLTRRSGKEAMLGHKVWSTVVHGAPGVAMACRTVGYPLLADIFRVCTRKTVRIGAGIQQTHHQQKN